MSAFNRLRLRLARWVAPTARTATRTYAAARRSRLTEGWGQSNTSADTELVLSLATLRQRSRALVRDAAYAKRAKVIVTNNIIGGGIGMQAQVKNSRGALNKRINDDIELAWEKWCRADSCHTGGTLHFSDLERVAVGQIFEAGEVLIRKHYSKFGDSAIPYALELIEAERLAEEFQGPVPPTPATPGHTIRMGVEVDQFHRPVAYYVRSVHPGELRVSQGQIDRLERVPADQIMHVRLVDRWPQTRGEPWLHAVARKLNDMDGYSEAEIIAARGAASYMAAIESPESEPSTAEKMADGSREIALEPGIVEHLQPGEKMNFHSPNRPNPNMDPFMRMMLREVAAGAGTSYESISRDYSQSNYSSSRLALIDDRDLWRMLQMWFIRSFREMVHGEWLQQAVLSRAVASIRIEEYTAAREKFNRVRFKPRGWSWIDPTKEVAAYKEAVKAGFITTTEVIALTNNGRDIEDVLDERRSELDLMEQKQLIFDTDPSIITPVATAPPDAPPDPGDEDATNDDNKKDDPPMRVVSFGR